MDAPATCPATTRRPATGGTATIGTATGSPCAATARISRSPGPATSQAGPTTDCLWVRRPQPTVRLSVLTYYVIVRTIPSQQCHHLHRHQCHLLSNLRSLLCPTSRFHLLTSHTRHPHASTIHRHRGLRLRLRRHRSLPLCVDRREQTRIMRIWRVCSPGAMETVSIRSVMLALFGTPCSLTTSRASLGY
jgi:hypothetical protein